MKLMKKLLTILFAFMMVLTTTTMVFADDGTSLGTSPTKGSITINNAVDKNTYKIYKILELESFYDEKTTGGIARYAYKPVAGFDEVVNLANSEGKTYLKKNVDGYVEWNSEVTITDEAKRDFAKKALEKAVEKNITCKDAEANGTSVTFNDLDLGYYVVSSSVGALCSLDTTNPNVTINEKNGVPSLTKKVSNNETSYANTSSTASIGDTVYFQIEISAADGAENYVLHDKLSDGLTLINDSIKVLKDGAHVDNTRNLNYIVKIKGTSGVTLSGEYTFEIEFKKAFCDTLTSTSKITVTYSATLNGDAVIAGAGNTNEAKLSYGTNKTTNGETTTTKSYEIPVYKYYEENGTSNTKKALAGAKFKLSKEEAPTTEDQYLDFVHDSATNTYRKALTTEGTSTKEMESSTTGEFKMTGLNAGVYYLHETEAPKGFNKLSKPVKITITSDGKIKVKDDTAEVTRVEVENKSGTILPSTGGVGTTMMYIVGAVLLIGSGVILITKKNVK